MKKSRATISAVQIKRLKLFQATPDGRLHSGNLTVRWLENPPFESMYFLLKKVDFPASYVCLLGCPRKLGSMVSKWVITPVYPSYR